MKRDEFKHIFARIMNFYNIKITEMAFLEFCDSFKEYQVEALEKSFTKLKLVDLSTSRKDEMLPAVIRELSKILGGSDEDKSIIAWDKVLCAMNRYGAYRSVAFKDRAIMKAIDLVGGWIGLNNMGDNELKWAKKDFMSYYKAFANKQIGLTHLQGVEEKENQYLAEPPKQTISLIGFKNQVSDTVSLSSYLEAQNNQRLLSNEKMKKLIDKVSS